MSEQTSGIEVELAGRTYRVNVKDSEKGIFEEASAIVGETIKSYEAKYAYKQKQDLLAVVLLQYATSLIRQSRSRAESGKEVRERLEALLGNIEKSI